MKADLKQIGEDGFDLVSELSVPWLQEILGHNAIYRPKAPGQLVAHLTRNDDMVMVQGSSRIEVEASCARCLETVTIVVNTPLEVTLIPRQTAFGPDAQGQLSQDEVSLATYDDSEIDVGAVVRDEVLLELPMRALCSTDCQGLCAECGKNLNREACACRPGSGDVRLAGLARIKLA